MEKLHHIFAQLESESRWYPYRSVKDDIPEKLHDWLLHRHSFMKRLLAYGAQSPTVQVQQQKWQKPFLDERHILQIAATEHALTREVIIESPQHIWMAARTVFPRRSLVGKNQQLARLKTRSLGSVLFRNPHLVRSDFEFASLTNDLWARRSIFHVNSKPLLLCEIFFPAVAELRSNHVE